MGNQVPCKGDTGAMGTKGDTGDMGAMGAPGAPATTNDHFMFNPKGQLQGVVYDQYDRRPITGARVSIAYNGMIQTVTTDGTGLYSFRDLPANSGVTGSHGTGAGGGVAWTGAYTLSLDLSMVQDTDHHYRSYQQRRATVIFTALSDGESPGGSDQNTDTQVDDLLANLDFPVRQIRGQIEGNVYNVETRVPMADFQIVAAYTLAAGPDLSGNAVCPATPLGNAEIDTTGQVAGNAQTDAMGHFSVSGIEEGVCYTLAPSDQNYSIVAGGNNAGTAYPKGGKVYASENNVIVTVPDVLVQHTVGRDNVPPYVTSATPADNNVLLAGAALDQNISLTFSEPMDQSLPVHLATHLFWGLNQGFNLTGTNTGNRSFPCRTFGPVPPGDNPANGAWGVVGDTSQACLTLLEVFTINSWDAAGQVMTIDPQVNFIPGLSFTYRLDVDNSLLHDLAGNSRTGCLPASQLSSSGDALSTEAAPMSAMACATSALGAMGTPGPGGNAPDSLVFTFQAGANALTVATCATDPMTGVRSGLCQELDTADTQGSPTTPAAITVRSTDTTFLGLLGAGLYSATTVPLAGAAPTSTQDAYVRWDPVSGAVAYVIYYKDAFYPMFQPLQLLLPGSGQTPAQRFAFNISIGEINTRMQAIYGASPTTGFVNLDRSWITGRTGAGLHFQLGVAAVNVDGIEGPITEVDIQDTTTPQVATNFVDTVMGAAGVSGLGGDFHFNTGTGSTLAELPALADGIILTDAEDGLCKTNPGGTGNFNQGNGTVGALGVGRISCLSAPDLVYGTLTAASYGQRTIVLELSEPVPVTQLVPANLQYVSGFVQNSSGNTTDPNGNEADPTIVAAGPVFPTALGAPGPFAKFLGVTVDNIFHVDSGDVILLDTATGGVADVAGNVANPARSSRFAITGATATGFRFLDRLSPMLRSATMDATANTVTLAFTKHIFQDTVCTSVALPNCPMADNAGTNLGPTSNYDRANVSFDSIGGTGAFFPSVALAASRQATVGTFGTQAYSAVYTSNAAGDVVVWSFADISWMRDGGSVLLQGVRNADWWQAKVDDSCRQGLDNTAGGCGPGTGHAGNRSGTSRATNFTDRGTEAFVNLAADRFSGLAAGAYNPDATTGVGSNGMADTIGPRFSQVDIGPNQTHRSANIGLGTGVLGGTPALPLAQLAADPGAIQNWPNPQPTVVQPAQSFPTNGIPAQFDGDVQIGNNNLNAVNTVRISSSTGGQIDTAINGPVGGSGANLLGRQITIAGFGTGNGDDPTANVAFNGTFTIASVNNGSGGGFRSIDMTNSVPNGTSNCGSGNGCGFGSYGAPAYANHTFIIRVPAVFPKANEWAVNCQQGAGTTSLTGRQVRVHLTDRTGATVGCNTGDPTCGSCNTLADCASKWQIAMQTFGGCIGADLNGNICNNPPAIAGAAPYAPAAAACSACSNAGWFQGSGNATGTNNPLTATITSVDCSAEDTSDVDNAGAPTANLNGGELCTITFNINSTQAGSNDSGCGSNGITARGGGIASITMSASLADRLGNVASTNRVLNFASGTTGRNGTVTTVDITTIGWIRP